MKIKTYQEAVTYLERFIKPIVFRKISLEQAYIKDPLDRMRLFLKLLGNPQDKFRSIQVSGTSGKGSTAYFISQILSQAGYKVGFATSPHLVKINERIQVTRYQKLDIRDKENRNVLMPISDDEFIDLLNEMIPAIEKMSSRGRSAFGRNNLQGEPSYFEITMAMAFYYFAGIEVDIGIVEVGIEGRYDASNVLHPLIAVLTNIDLDHTDILGSTVEEIAIEASSIISNIKNQKSEIQIKNQKVITGIRRPEVLKIIEEKCKKEGAKLLRIDNDFSAKLKKESIEGTRFDFSSVCEGSTLTQGGTLTDMFLSMRGAYQIENAAVAIQTVLALQKLGFKVSKENIRTALSTAFFPGRFELLRLASLAQDKMSGTLILDGAHNPAKMHAFITSLKKIYQKHKKVFIIAFKGNKDMLGMIKEIVAVADVIIATEFDSGLMGYVSTGSAKAEEIRDKILEIRDKISGIRGQSSELKVQKFVYATKSVEEALRKAINVIDSSPRLWRDQNDNRDNIIVLTGSLYLVGEAKQQLFRLIV